METCTAMKLPSLVILLKSVTRSLEYLKVVQAGGLEVYSHLFYRAFVLTTVLLQVFTDDEKILG
jgi:hypothetical protein